LTESEIKKLFKNAGWNIESGAKHDMAIHPATGVKIPIPRHKGDIPTGTAHRMLKEAGLK
jgi:predicted RNA binding protein YcfA (HicA-like mRNA interferase family)